MKSFTRQNPKKTIAKKMEKDRSDREREREREREK